MAVQWTYMGKEIEKVSDVFLVDPELAQQCQNNTFNLYGFVYLVTFPSGKLYIGKRNFFYIRDIQSRLSKLPRAGHMYFHKKRVKGHLVEYEVFKKENEWLDYQGSAQYCLDHECEKKEILEITTSKRYLTYLEIKYQFIHNVLEDDRYINDNISGRYFKGNLKSDEVDDYCPPIVTEEVA